MKVTVQSHFKASQQQPQGTLTAASIWTHLHVHPSLCLIVCFLEEMARVLDGTLARFSKLSMLSTVHVPLLQSSKTLQVSPRN